MQVVFTILAIFSLIAAVTVVIYNVSSAVPLALALSFIFPFIALIHAKWTRSTKGIALILFGVFWSSVFADGLKQLLLIRELFTQHSGIFMLLQSLAIYSCAGAGGGVLASYADQFSKDGERADIQLIDNSGKFKHLSKQIESLRKRFTIVLWFLSIILAIQLLLFLN